MWNIFVFNKPLKPLHLFIEFDSHLGFELLSSKLMEKGVAGSAQGDALIVPASGPFALDMMSVGGPTPTRTAAMLPDFAQDP